MVFKTADSKEKTADGRQQTAAEFCFRPCSAICWQLSVICHQLVKG
jgi:hypothetical protein